MRALIAVTGAAVLAAACAAAENEGGSAADHIAAARAVAPSVAFVEYELKYDKGEVRGPDSYWNRAEDLIAQERPMELDAFLLEPTLVAAPDIAPHPRFIKSVRVRYGDELVEASPAGYFADYPAVLLKLARPLPGTKPLEFTPDAEGPYLNIFYDLRDEGWRVKVTPFAGNTVLPVGGAPYVESDGYSVITTEDGRPVGLSMTGRLPADGSWKGSPLKWRSVSAGEMDKLLAELKRNTDACLLRTKLNLRSPKAKPGDRYSFMMMDDDANATENNVVSVLVEPRKALVLANLRPKATARLERITVFDAGGTPVSATFLHTLKDYGCFVAELEKPLPGPVVISAQPVASQYGKLLLSAEVSVQGDNRVAYLDRARIVGFKIGWQRRVYPELRDDSDNTFLFDLQGRLVALPVVRRQPAAQENRWMSRKVLLTPAAFLQEALRNVPESIDPSNVPLSEEEENRLAWIGAELQALDKELARANGVADQTQDGETGALVSYVYPGSPAAAAGVQPGWILLRVQVEGEPKPIEVQLDEYVFDRVPFPWDRLDELPEQLYDQIPKPWPPVENQFIRALTDVGFGRSFTAEFFADGKKLLKQFKVVESPPHFDSAPQYEAEDLGITVRDLTYEVRRYFQKKADDPGVIVSKVEPGSKASVAGIKPYEIITHINDQPVTDVESFQKLCAGKDELKLSVKRMTRGRLVPIKTKTPGDGEE